MKIESPMKLFFNVFFRQSGTLGLMLIIACSPKCGMAQVDPDNRKELQENPSERERFRHLQRADEHGEIQFGALTSAKAQMDLRRAKVNPRIPNDAGIWNWEWLGPGNIGGRIRAILIDPVNSNAIWIGGVSGGIWKTFNGGSSWYPVDDFMANLAVTSIVMDPTNTNIMYASTGEGFSNTDALQGAGIFKSVDGGNTWSQLASTNNSGFLFTNRLAHHPTEANTLIAVTNGGIQRTTDGGVHWSILNGTSNGTDVKYNPSDGNVVMVGTKSDLVLSRYGGDSLKRQTTGAPGKLPNSPGRCEVAFTAANGAYLYTLINRNKGEIWRSTDGGLTWARRTAAITTDSVLGAFGWYANAIAVSPTDPNFVVVGGTDLWRSTDGGATMMRISNRTCYPDCIISHSAHADQHAIVFPPDFNGSTNRNVFVGNDGGIQMTNDISTVGGGYGNGWVSLANSLGVTQFYGGAASPDGSVIVGGAQDNGQPEYTPSSGQNGWNYSQAIGDGGQCAIDNTNYAIRYGENVNLQIMKRTNLSIVYQGVFNGITDACTNPFVPCATANFIAPFSMDPNNSLILVAGGASIWRTINGAASWSSIRSPLAGGGLCSAIDIAKGNSSVIWVGYNSGMISFTSDGGTSWTNVGNTTPGFQQRFVSDIAINPAAPEEVFVTFGGYLTDDIWMTTNSGTTWTLRQGNGLTSVPAIQVNTIRYHPLETNWIYIGTDLGIFASEDKGLTWNTTPLYARNEGPVNVEVDELFWQGDEYLIAATHGRGMFRCRPLPIVYVDQAYIGVEDGTLYRPYNTIQQGIDAAGNGTTLSINLGIYQLPAPLAIRKRMKLKATSQNVFIK